MNRELQAGDLVVLPNGRNGILGKVERVGVVYAYVFFNKNDLTTPVDKRLLLRISNTENIIEENFCSVTPYEYLKKIIEN